MSERLTLPVRRRLSAAAFSTTSLFALLIAGSSAFAQAPQSAPAMAAPATMAASRCRLDSAPRYSPTISVTCGIWRLRRMACSTSTRGAAAIFRNDTPPAGGFLVALKDSKGNGHADMIKRFGDGVPQGSAGGTGIAYYNGAIYAEQNDKIIRYVMPTKRFDRADGQAGDRRFRAAAHRRPPYASVHHRCARPHLRRPRLGHQFLPDRQPHAGFARARSVHRTGNPRRHLAL